MKTLLELYLKSVNKYSYNILFNSNNKQFTYFEFNKHVNKNKFLLKEYNIKPNDNVIFIGNNSEHWAGMNFASYQIGNRFIPIYKSQHPDIINYIIKETKPKLIIYQDINLNTLIEKTTLSNIYTLNISSLNFDSLYEYEKIDWVPKPNDSNIILYTSGTTGLSKGVLLTHQNLYSNIESIDKLIGDQYITNTDKYVNFLPWSHIYGLNCELNYGFSKGSNFYINNKIENLITDFTQQNPTIICTVPKLLNNIYEKLKSNNLTKILSNDNLLPYTNHYLRKKIFGSKIRFINVGGASISKDLILFYSKLGINIYQGYGLSETSPIVSINTPKLNKIGSVGKILDCNNVKIIDDEIFIKGSNVFKGYYNNPIETSNVFDTNEYFKSGDTGYIDLDNYLWITGRKKDLYKLDNGKYINPSYIENILLESYLIKQIFIYGNNKSYNIALIVSNEKIETIINQIKKYSNKLKKYEIPKKILLVEPFTFENKLLTPKMTMIRNNIYIKYKNEIDNLYLI
jgi:long-chain acyl-CoA synthetase